MELANKIARGLTSKDVIAAFERLGYQYFDGFPFDMNIFGVRRNLAERDADYFDDAICAAFKNALGVPVLHVWPATTDPGLRHLQDPVFPAAQKDGTAIMAPGQYLSAYSIGAHGRGSSRHAAFVQRRPVTIYRDANLDDRLDLLEESKIAGMFGINIHSTGVYRRARKVGRYSAGCQVLQYQAHLDELISYAKKQGVNRFTYTLLNENELFE